MREQDPSWQHGDESNAAFPLLGRSDEVERLRRAVHSQSEGTDPILLRGPPGSGHWAVAQAIVKEGSRKGPFHRVHAARLQDEQESPFLSVDNQTRGIFDAAAGGTLFLDGLERLPLDRQSELRVLLESGKLQEYNVHLIVGTRVAKEALRNVDHGLLKIIGRNEVVIPALTERLEDIPVLAAAHLRETAQRNGLVVLDFDDEALDVLLSHHWARDLSELAEVVEHAVLTARNRRPIPRLSDEGSSLGGYQLIRRLGEGAHGEVWEARHRILSRAAAIKIVNGVGEPDSIVRELFAREARVTAQLNSPHTVTLFDFSLTSDGSAYYVMEMLKGADLGALLDEEGPLPAERVVYLLRQVCRSLVEAHEMGLVHRDIKHENLFVCRLGDEYDFLKVLDFGVVKVDRTGSALSHPQYTLSDAGPVGTVGYIAPEVINSRAPVDHRADIYSVGCVAYEMLTATHVFEGKTEMEQLIAHVQKEPSPPSSALEVPLPPLLEEIVLKCLAKSPSARFQNVRELDSALAEVEREFDVPWNRELARSAWNERQQSEQSSSRSGAEVGVTQPGSGLTR